MAQQPQPKPPGNSMQQMHSGQQGNGYTYKVFEAPDKMFGYDIYQNGKILFHQAAAMVSPNTADANQKALQQNISVIPDRYALPTALAQKEFAENAALLSIEKIKKRSAPALTIEEMKQVRVNKILTPIQKN